MKKALTNCAPGSGRHETYVKLSLEANKSMSKRPQRSFIALKTPWDKDHSVDSDPGIWVARSQILRLIHHSHTPVAYSKVPQWKYFHKQLPSLHWKYQ